MGHSKHKRSTKKTCCTAKKVVIWHPYLHITATSLQQLLSSVPKVVACEQQTYFRSQGSLRTADVFSRLLFAGYPGGRCGRERFHVVVCLFFSGFLAFEHAWRTCAFRNTCTTSCKVVQMGFSFYVFIFYLFIWLKKVIIQRESASFYLENVFVSLDLFLRWR